MVDRLTPKETNILQLASKGLTDKQISLQLQISRGTLITHWTRMKSKLQAANRGEMIAHLIRHEMSAAMKRDASIGGPNCMSVLSCIPDVVVVTGADSVIRFVNAEYERVTGLKRENVVGKTLFELSSDPTFARRWNQHLTEVLQNPKPATIYMRHHVQGQTVLLEITSIKSICAKGESIMVSTVRDASGRLGTVKPEIISAATDGPDVVVVFDAFGRVTFANSAVKNLLGFCESDPRPSEHEEVFEDSSIEKLIGSIIPETNRDGSWTGTLRLKGKEGLKEMKLTFLAHRDREYRVTQMSMFGHVSTPNSYLNEN